MPDVVIAEAVRSAVGTSAVGTIDRETVIVGGLMATLWKKLGPSNGRQWPGTGAGAAAAMGIGAALGGLPPPLLAVLGSLSIALAAFSGWWTFMQRRDAQRRGTVYVVREPGTSADEWEHDEAQAQEFINALRLSFPEVRQVPGPSELHRWPWPLGEGAELWDHYVDELVTAIRVVRRGDNPRTQKSLVVWARWPVAIAAVSRLLSAERGPVPGIRQRVSYGRSPRMERVDPAQAALSFDPVRQEDSHPEASQTSTRRLRRRLTPGTWSGFGASAPPRAQHFTHHGTITISGRPTRGRTPRTQNPAKVTVLLVRLNSHSWGPLVSEPARDGQLGQDGIKVEVDDAEGIGIDGTFCLEIREWRCLPADPGAQGAHRWSHFEAIAEEVTRWIAAEVPAQPGCPLLLGTVMPQEIGLGIGIHIHRRDAPEWPSHLFPLVWNTHCFVIPHLDLGWESLRTARRNTVPPPSPDPSGLGRLRSWLELVRR